MSQLRSVSAQKCLDPSPRTMTAAQTCEERNRRDGQRARQEGANIETRVGLQAALNGDLTKAEHAATLVSVEELARDAAACVAAGARAIHLHPRDFEGRETLDAGVVEEVVTKVRGACGVPVGTTTSAEIEPGPERRLGLVQAWREELQLRDSGDKAPEAVGLVEDIHGALDELGLASARLQHGDGRVTWVLLRDAVRRGLDTRVGLEDTLRGPDGERTTGNEALVRAARELGAA